MISLNQLQNKLNNQTKNFALLLEFPQQYAERLWSIGVYDCATIPQAHERLRDVFDSNDLNSILTHDSFKYLIINEYDDQEIIESLHKEITAMASRIES